MDKIECVVVFILAILVTISPLGMLADLLWRRREGDRYIVEVWNADHTRLITTIMATPGVRIPPTGERIANLEGLQADGPQEPLVETERLIEPEEDNNVSQSSGRMDLIASQRERHYHTSLNQRVRDVRIHESLQMALVHHNHLVKQAPTGTCQQRRSAISFCHGLS